MKINVPSVDYAPTELKGQTPIQLEVLKKVPGSGCPDYWLAVAGQPIRWLREGQEARVSHIIISARWQGTQIGPGMNQLPIGIAYVTDSSFLDHSFLDFKKCAYVAIGTADEL